jgi:hypothetical protein
MLFILATIGRAGRDRQGDCSDRMRAEVRVLATLVVEKVVAEGRFELPAKGL